VGCAATTEEFDISTSSTIWLEKVISRDEVGSLFPWLRGLALPAGSGCPAEPLQLLSMSIPSLYSLLVERRIFCFPRRRDLIDKSRRRLPCPLALSWPGLLRITLLKHSLQVGVDILLESVGWSLCHTFPDEKILLLTINFCFDRTSLSLIPRLQGNIDIVTLTRVSRNSAYINYRDNRAKCKVMTEVGLLPTRRSYSTYRTDETE